MKKNEPVTGRQRALIRKWTLARILEQQEIAAKLDLSRVAVWKVQKALGLSARPTLSKKTQKRIATLLRKQWPGRRIERELGIGPRWIARIARRMRHRRRRGSIGCAYRLSAPEVTAIRRAITKSERTIAKKFHVSRSWLRRFRLGSFSRKPK